jgi:hypothetical protein
MAIVTLVLSWGLPIIGIAFGKFVTHQFYPRYVIGAMFGVIVLMTLIVWFGFMRRKEMAVIVWLVICVLFAHTAVYEMRFALRERAHPLQARIRTYIPALVRSDELPIVAPNSFMEVYYYSDPAIRRRIRFVTSERTALRLEGRTDIERAMILSAPYFRTPVVNYDEFVRKYPNFYIIGGPRWIVPRLIEEGAHLELVKGGAGDNPTEDINYIFRVNMPSR